MKGLTRSLIRLLHFTNCRKTRAEGKNGFGLYEETGTHQANKHVSDLGIFPLKILTGRLCLASDYEKMLFLVYLRLRLLTYRKRQIIGSPPKTRTVCEPSPSESAASTLTVAENHREANLTNSPSKVIVIVTGLSDR
ncbi:hypothetical protein Hamer_G013635 [Homarus americanus]|uniref:Uncharacterized protein n=1 Tax=Homarus americanus TaxID=6706 RepID=A0A8J5JZQ0_HOMAM|nr:hypothetical protein Hamer_G013635 [Homarus americanus]